MRFPRLRSRNKDSESGEMYFNVSYGRRKEKVSDVQLTGIFDRIGHKYGYSSAYAGFENFGDMKVTWQRSAKLIDFRITDYLDHAPDEVLEDLAECLYTRIGGGEREASPAFVKYVTDPKFSRTARKTYLERSVGLSETGERFDLRNSLDRLKKEGLVPQDIDLAIRWQHEVTQKASGCSVLMRVVWVNKMLDSRDVPFYVLDYCIYCAICGILVGYKAKEEDKQLWKLRRLYPKRREAEDWLFEHEMFI